MSEEMSEEDQPYIRNVELSDAVNTWMQDFAASNIFRQIADSRDGLKPVQRRILWQSELLGLHPKAKYTKVVRLLGQVMGNFHPHGDSSIGGAIVTLSQDWTQDAPMIDIHGNNGSIDGSPHAAFRYIEARQSPLAPLMLKDIKKNAVDMTPNFDQTMEEPRYLPAAIPFALINGTQGVAFGLRSNILPHNPREMVEAALKLVDKPNASSEELSQIIQGPDFPTKGQLKTDHQAVLDEIETGEAKFTVRAKIDIHPTKKDPYLDITEVPYGVKLDKLIAEIEKKLEDYRKVLGHARPINASTGGEIHIQIICKNGTPKLLLEQIRQYLFDNTKCQIPLTAQNRLLYRGHPQVRGIRDYLLNFLDFRLETLKRVWEYEHHSLSERIEIIDGLLRVSDITDDVVAEAKKSISRANFEETLQNKFDFTALQAKAIAGIAIYQLGKRDISQLTAERDSKQAQADQLKKQLTDEAAAKEALKADLRSSLAVFGKSERKTEFFRQTSEQRLEKLQLSDEQLTEKKKINIVIKTHGFNVIGRKAYQNQIDNYKRRDIAVTIPSITNQYVIGITQTGKAATRYIDDLPNVALENDANPLYREITELTPDDEFIGGITFDATHHADLKKKIMMITKYGYIKVIRVEKLMPNVKRKYYVSRLVTANGLKHDGDEVIYAHEVTEDFLKNHRLVVQLDGYKRRRVIDLSKLADRSDGRTTSGGAYINTGSPKGKYPVKSFEFDELPQEDAADNDEKEAAEE